MPQAHVRTHQLDALLAGNERFLQFDRPPRRALAARSPRSKSLTSA
jgi:hypothetical protein